MKKLTTKEMSSIRGGAWYDGTCNRRRENQYDASLGMRNQNTPKYQRSYAYYQAKYAFWSAMSVGCPSRYNK
ncbi:MAG: hypothetical protein GY864_01430 [Desulfobacterales bacterium]|nr:hypothetical protein [Desulfobacterales bacterium]